MANEMVSSQIDACLRRLAGGDDRAREQIIELARERLTHFARKMLKGFGRVKRWEETDDVVQNSLLRLYRALSELRPTNAIEFYRLASLHIRRELIDLARHHFGPLGQAAHHVTYAGDAGPDQSEPGEVQPIGHDTGRLEDWASFHDHVERLPDDEKEVFDLLWYQELSQAEVATLLGVSERTVKRRWASARLKIHDALEGRSPEA